MKIIFLDVDGVLNSQRFFNEREKKGNDLDENCIIILAKIVEGTNAQIVVSSTWRLHKNCFHTLRDRLRLHKIRIIGNTITDPNRERADEVNHWIKNHEDYIESFCIIDDDTFDWNKYGYQNNWVKPSFYENGLEEKHVEQAIKILNKE